MPINHKSFTYDHSLLLKASAAVTATAASNILDLGASRTDVRLIVDVSAIDTTSGDESYRLRVQVSNSATFASGIFCPVTLELGDSTVTGNSADSATGRYEVPFSNEVNGVTYRYVRVNQVIAGTTPSYTAAIYIVKEA
jgi:hypothetical protein